jgi:hypothetical protein
LISIIGSTNVEPFGSAFGFGSKIQNIKKFNVKNKNYYKGLIMSKAIENSLFLIFEPL